MADTVNKTLIVPHLFGPGGYWKTLAWQKSFEQGMKVLGLPYSGKHRWVETVIYWGLTHETMPAKNALAAPSATAHLQARKPATGATRTTVTWISRNSPPTEPIFPG